MSQRACSKNSPTHLQAGDKQHVFIYSNRQAKLHAGDKLIAKTPKGHMYQTVVGSFDPFQRPTTPSQKAHTPAHT